VTSGLPKRAFERYELLRPLGEGGAGTVYAALDRETGAQVALKTLTRMTPLGVLRFKREFRALADIRHRNLVKLYELEHADDAWFLTMELVDGVPLLSDLDDGADDARERAIFERFLQLAQGVQAIHQAGMLHCDLKPSNVMLEHGGRVVVLDFGLVRELSTSAADLSVDGTTSGTPAYMPPEQARGEELSTASDWYAFGAMLYQALSGVLPIDGRTALELIQRKLHVDAPSLPQSAGPRAARELCTGLLRRNPRERAEAQTVMRVLSALLDDSDQDAPQSVTSEVSTLTADVFMPDTQTGQTVAELFGRDAERLQLEAALARCIQTHAIVCEHVCGPSGSGKTALIQSFLTQGLQLAGDPLVLRSRCYERETIAFKSIDGVVDALVTFLISQDEAWLAHLFGRDLAALTALFPAFEHIPLVQRLLAHSKVGGRGDALQLRRRAEEAFRSLLYILARSRPVVIWIDDLQWGDLDSAQMLQDWLMRPIEAPVLLIMSYRSDETATSACLSALVSPAAKSKQLATQHGIELRPMQDSDVHALCSRRFGAAQPLPPIIAKIVRDAQGNPFLATQLTALAAAKLSRGDSDLRSLSVEDLVLHTSSLLSESALNLLRVLSVAGRPLAPRIALQASNVTRNQRARVDELQTLRLVRTRYVSGKKLLDIYHDRVRTSIEGSLTVLERKRIHQTLLDLLLSHGSSDNPWLHELALGAGQPSLARHYGLLAADAANANLAFERAAELYGRCLPHVLNDGERSQVLQKLAAAHVRCRRGKQAATAYLEASKLAGDQERTELLHLAAAHLLRSGYFEEGERVVKQVLAALEISVPRSELGLYAAIGWERARIAVLQRRVTPRADVVLPPSAKRLGTLYAMLALDTQCHMPLRAALFQMRATRMCFQYGERQTTARAYCMNAALATLSAESAYADEMLARAEALIDVSNDPETLLELYVARAFCAGNLGREAEMIEPARAAEQLYETNSVGGALGDYFYMFIVRAMLCSALQFLGRHTEASEEVRRLLSDAAATDNRCAALLATMVRTGHEQVDNGCRESRARLDAERSELPADNLTALHLLHTMAVLRTACATGEHDWALSIYADFEPKFESSPLKRSVYLVYLLRIHHARLVLNQHVALGHTSDPEHSIRTDLRWLNKHAPPTFRKPTKLRLLGRAALIRGERVRAAELLEQSRLAHAELGAADEAERDRYALGLLMGGDQGSQLTSQAIAALSGLGVRDPTQEIRGFFPELFR
jgi:hypothetical protein